LSQSEHTVVAGLLQKPSRIASVKVLKQEFFKERFPCALFKYAVAYYKRRDGKNALDLALARSKIEQSKSKISGELLDLLAEYERYEQITDPEFREALIKLLMAHKEEVIREHGTLALEAMISGKYDEATNEMRKGLLAAEDVQIEDDSPVDIRSPEQVADAREQAERPPDNAKGFDIGFVRLMRHARFRRQELTILSGYAADGKTQLSKAFAYNANQAGANVLFVALEMTREEMRTLFIAQHAATIDPKGVDWVAILSGEASKQDKKLWHRALDDFEIKRHDDHEEMETRGGKLVIWAPRRSITQDDWVSRVRAARDEDDIDIAIKDYTELVKPGRGRDLKQYRLNLKDMIEEDKSLAREESARGGIWVVDNHQISRSGRDSAEKRKPIHYLKRDLGESSGLERAADHIVWVYSDFDFKDDREALVGMAKARKGKELVHGYHVYADFAKAVIGERVD